MKSKQNLELKHYCNDFEKVRVILKELGAGKETVKDQKDYFFNLPTEKEQRNARLKLRIENEKMTLVYYERPDFVSGKEITADIALLETDETTLYFLQKSLGVSAIVEKTREVWRKDHTVFNLDDVKNVGNIFEIELQKEGEITLEDKKLFKKYQGKILPYLGEVIAGSNVDLVKSKNA